MILLSIVKAVAFFQVGVLVVAVVAAPFVSAESLEELGVKSRWPYVFGQLVSALPAMYVLSL